MLRKLGNGDLEDKENGVWIHKISGKGNCWAVYKAEIEEPAYKCIGVRLFLISAIFLAWRK